MLLLVCSFTLFLFAACSSGGEDPTQTTTVGPNPTQTTTNQGGQQATDENGNPIALYKISFYTGDGATQVDAMSNIKAGDKIEAPTEPKLAYHSFDGWFTDYGTYQNEFTFDTMPAQNLTLYAKWTSTISGDTLAQYEEELAKTSQEGHLYIHYLRFQNVAEDYEALNLWIWPYQYTGRTFDWVRDASGKIVVDDIAGATCDIDLTRRYQDAGKEGHEIMQFLVDSAVGTNYKAGDVANPDNYMNPKAGFLIVYKDSKNSGTHWRSDGNADQLFFIEDALWENKSLHIFCVQDNVSSYVFHITNQEPIVNPYENDDGSHVSISNVNSSETLKLEYGTELFDTVTGVGYQIMVSSFADSNGDGIGDIRGIINNFDYLEKLNVDVIWLTPIQLSDSYHGYDIIDYKAVDPKFGTLDDYKELLTLAHSKGMKVIMDLVLNHTSTNNVWFQNSAKMIVGEDGTEYRNFYQWRNHEKEKDLSKDWYPYSEYAYSYYGKFSPSMPELNYDYQGTRDAIVDVALYWLDILGNHEGVDGFRIDAVKHIYMADEVTPNASDIIISDYDTETESDYSSNLTKNINFFTYLANQIKKDHRDCYLVGENFDGHAYNVAPYYTAFDGMLDFYMYYSFGEIAKYHGVASNIAGGNTSSDGSLPKGSNTNKLRQGEWDFESVTGVERAYSKYGLSGTDDNNNDVIPSLFTSNHDIPRLMNNMVRNYSGANWEAGTITADNKDYAETYAKATLATMMMLPGVTYIYYGDELGMSSNYNVGETKLSPHIDRQYRQPFKWEKGMTDQTTDYSISGDTTLYVRWDSYNEQLAGVKEQDTDPNSFLNYVRYWTKLKSEDEVIRYGDYTYKPVDWGGGNIATALFAFTRSYSGKTYWVITNFDEYDYEMGNILGGYKLVAVSNGGSLTKLPKGGTVVVEI